MADLILIIMIAISLGLYGGLLYFIYLPFKNRLRKSGKLTDKLNRIINRTFILSLCMVGVMLYCFKDYRTSSKYRLENISDIKLPTDFKVLKDEYQDMWQDYCILYDIHLSNNATNELIKNIKSSKYYNKNTFHKGAWTEKDFIEYGSVKAVWSKSPNGFDFSKPYGLTTYYIELDTVINILKYSECGD